MNTFSIQVQPKQYTLVAKDFYQEGDYISLVKNQPYKIECKSSVIFSENRSSHNFKVQDSYIVCFVYLLIGPIDQQIREDYDTKYTTLIHTNHM